MPIRLEQRGALMKAERSRHAETIADAISAALEASPGATMLDAEMVFRESGAQTYLVANGDQGNVKICFGIAEALAALDAAGRTPTVNREALGAIT